jgi:endonuclease VIII
MAQLVNASRPDGNHAEAFISRQGDRVGQRKSARRQSCRRLYFALRRRDALLSSAVPEGHTIHRLALDHTKDLGGQIVRVSSPQGRMAQGAELVNDSVLARIDPYGKHLFYRFGDKRPDRATTIHVHLGLFGKFARHRNPPPQPRDTVRMRIEGDSFTIDLTGPTDCRVVDPVEEQTIRDRLGPDPIRPDADPEKAWARLSKRKSTIGEALMDQKVMAGVGNVYRAESLFVHGIHPNRPANQLDRYLFDALWSTIVAMLRQGVKDKRIITVARDELSSFGPRSRIRGKDAVYVYKKDQCMRCETPIDRWDLAGRWAYACPTCQPD